MFGSHTMVGAIPNFPCKQFDVHISDNIVLRCDKSMSSTHVDKIIGTST